MSQAVSGPDSVGAKIDENQNSQTIDDTVYLGKLNRHWYRRCLDKLDAQLRNTRRDPSVNELNLLFKKIITNFLEAVTGQAPDSDRPQFPADRAYYIPFDGDKVKRFDSSKCFYQYPSESGKEKLSNSIFTFRPWSEGAEDNIRINAELSVRDGETISFADMISVRELFRGSEGLRAQSQDESKVFLKKSLLLREEDETLLQRFVDNVHGKSPQPSISLRSRTDKLREEIVNSLAAIFDAYRLTPGNSGMETILLNHIHVLHWLIQLNDLDDQDYSQHLQLRSSEFDNLFERVLGSYFLSHPADHWTGRGDQKKNNELIQALVLRFTNNQLAGKDSSESKESLFERLSKQRGSKFIEGVQAIRENSNKSSIVSIVEEHLTSLDPFFMSFRDDFLNADREHRINQEQLALLENPLFAGNTKESFVWVCPDYADVEESLPKVQKVKKESAKDVQELMLHIVQPYTTFFQCLDIVQLAEVQGAIKQYWRTLSQANKQDRILGSFSEPSLEILDPKLSSMDSSNKELYYDFLDKEVNRPQNIFLRVRVCDSKNESVINGQFVFTSDHDESVYKGESQEKRNEDVEDLLSFSKVYFFIVRDFLHGLDRARVAVDVGKLNQDLYDKSISRLDQMMLRRQAKFKEGLTERKNWNKFIYEVLNAYAYSLIEKPADVRQETFPFDRLLLIPLVAEVDPDQDNIHAKRSKHVLPMYYFQTLFLERSQGRVLKSHYSLLKPFQSPIETLEQSNFTIQTFQQASHEEGHLQPLPKYLEKHYVSATEFDQDILGSTEEPASYLVKAIQSEEDQGNEKLVEDMGRLWAEHAIKQFFELSIEKKLWKGFLQNLTRDYREFLQFKKNRDHVTKRSSSNVKYEGEQWILFRIGLMRNILQTLFPTSMNLQTENSQAWAGAWEQVEKEYEEDWMLEFGSDLEIHIIDIAYTKRDPYAQFEKDKTFDVLRAHQSESVPFISYNFTNKDPFVLEFLQLLTNQVCNTSSESDTRTWYQPVLTRPLSTSHEGGPGSAKSVHDLAGETISDRIPPYEKIKQGEDFISTFMGIVNISIGQGQKDLRQIRYVVVLLRDYDDTKSSRVDSQEQTMLDLAEDLEDLQLYTSTYFRNVDRFVSNAVSRHRIEMLSTDVTQIARNWYSSGIDSITKELEQQLVELRQNSQVGELGNFAPQLIECFYDSVLNVLLRQEERPMDQSPIKLESFPFDRMIHVPINLSPTETSCLAYTRTSIHSDVATSVWNPEKPSAYKTVYEKIREFGRVWDNTNGTKKNAITRHVKLNSNWDYDSKLVRALCRLADPQIHDRFFRSLYEAEGLQTLGVAGTAFHFLKGIQLRNPEYWNSDAPSAFTLRQVTENLSTVLKSTLEAIDRQGNGALVETHVFMDESVRLPPLDEKDRKASKILGDIACVPFWHELFESLEPDGDFRYGLQSEDKKVTSKVFYVYYSIAAPNGMVEFHNTGGRCRGIFCLVLDDSSTDAKDDQGNIADQQDIRTLVHNAVGSLRMILEQQALHNELHKPGVEQFILGTLHRLKNKLGVPMVTLGNVDSILRAEENLDQTGDGEGIIRLTRAESTDLLESVARAKSTISDVEDLFKNLKLVSENQHKIAPLESFSSDWLAWQMVASISETAKSLLQKENRTDSVSEYIGELEQISRNALRNVDTFTIRNTSSKRKAQTQLSRLETILNKVRAPSRPDSEQLELTLSFDVFSSSPLYFYGSSELPEAFNILFENAFQALWKYTGEKQHLSRAIFEVICRKHENSPGEVLIEIHNTSEPPSDELLETLNNPVAQPVSTDQHKSSSGKAGGSGFGHFHARQVVMEFCGGSSKRRKLDIVIEKNESVLDQVDVSINLLEGQGNASVEIGVRDIAKAAKVVFKNTNVDSNFETVIQDNQDTACFFPVDLDPLSVLEIVNRLLNADYNIQQEGLHKILQSGPCNVMRVSTERLTNWILKQLRRPTSKLKETPNQVLENWTLRLERLRKYSAGDVTKLIETMKLFREESNETLNLIFQENELPEQIQFVQDTLQNFLLEGADLRPLAFVSPEYNKKFLSKKKRGFKQFAPHLKPLEGAAKEGGKMDSMPLYQMLLREVGFEQGVPVPIFTRVVEAFHKPCLDCEINTYNSILRMSFRLSEGEMQGGVSVHGKTVDLKTFDILFAKGGLARTFSKFSSTFEGMELPENNSTKSRFWFQPWEPESDQVPNRVVHLELPRVP